MYTDEMLNRAIACAVDAALKAYLQMEKPQYTSVTAAKKKYGKELLQLWENTGKLRKVIHGSKGYYQTHDLEILHAQMVAIDDINEMARQNLKNIK